MDHYSKIYIENNLFNNIDYDMLLSKHSLSTENYNNYFVIDNEEPNLNKEVVENNRMKKKRKFLTKLRNKIEEIKDTFFYDISEDDFFFWCWYVMIYEYDEYKTIKNKFELEKKIRYEYIEKARENKEELKKIHKIDVNKVIEILGNMDKCDYNTFKALCILSKINVCIEYNDMITCILYNDKELFRVLYHDNKYKLCCNKVDSEYIESHYNIENLDKPIYSISHYKVKDLEDMCKKLRLEVNNMKKKELYECIRMKLSEFTII